MKKCEDAASIVRAYEKIIKRRKKNIIHNFFTYRQGHIFRRFKQKENFIKMRKLRRQ